MRVGTQDTTCLTITNNTNLPPVSHTYVPETIGQALASKYGPIWRKAIISELHPLRQQKGTL